MAAGFVTPNRDHRRCPACSEAALVAAQLDADGAVVAQEAPGGALICHDDLN